MSLAEAPRVSRAEFLDRQRVAAGDAAALGLDGLLVWSTGGSALDGYADVFYLTNHYSQIPRVNLDIAGVMSGWGQTALVLPANLEQATLIVESADWRRDLVVADDVRESHDLVGEVVAALRDKQFSNARFGLAGKSIMPASTLERITSELPGLELVNVWDLVMRRRMIKSAVEIELMRRASLVGAGIQNAMMAAAAPGKTDNDLAREAFRVCLDEGDCQLGTVVAGMSLATSCIRMPTAAWTATSTTCSGQL
jgi:Xaa-Pro aminopeptidase